MFTRTNSKTHHIESKHKYSKSHSTFKKRNSTCIISFNLCYRGKSYISAIAPPWHLFSVSSWVDKSCDILKKQNSNFRGVCGTLWYLSEKLMAWQKGLRIGGKMWCEESKSEMSRNKSRRCTAVQNSAILFGGRL